MYFRFPGRPNAQCTEVPVFIDLNSEGEAVIEVADVNDGSVFACDGVFSLSPSTATCENVGQVLVVLSMTADNGEEDTCTAMATVRDIEEPLLTPNTGVIIANLGGSGEAILDVALLAEVSDNCGMEGGLVTASPPIVDCSNLASSVFVQVSAADRFGNEANAVTVRGEEFTHAELVDQFLYCRLK